MARRYKVKRFATEISTSEMEIEFDEEPTKERLEEEAVEIDGGDWDYKTGFPDYRYEFEEIT